MNRQQYPQQFLPRNTQLEIREHRQKYYAVLSLENQTLGITESFNTPLAASMAGNALLERYHNNLRAASVF